MYDVDCVSRRELLLFDNAEIEKMGSYGTPAAAMVFRFLCSGGGARRLRPPSIGSLWTD